MIHVAIMGFWPFGKGKDKADEGDVDFVSRVVAAKSGDGATIRGKLTVHLNEPGSQATADEVVSKCVPLMTEIIREAAIHEDLLDEEAHVAAKILMRLGASETRIRSLEVVALHVVGDAPPSATPRAPSVAPSRRPSSLPAERRPPSVPAPVSHRPAPVSHPPTSHRPEPAARPPLSSRASAGSGAPSRRPSSGQILAVRSEPIVPPNASPDRIGKAISPLARDAATKLLIAILRAYDLLVIRRLSVDDSPDLVAAVMPTSSAPLGFFADSRAEEIDRWEQALGLLKLEALKTEAATLTCALLHKSLEHARIPMSTATTILEKTSEGAFHEDSAALGQLGRYLLLVEVSPASELCEALLKLLGHTDELRKLEQVLTPVLASLQEDMSLAASQARASLGIRD